MPRIHPSAGFAAASLALTALALAALTPVGVGADTSGPDPSGYSWIDSKDPAPRVMFDWVDATGGTLSDISDYDDETQVVPLPFPFSFFGTEYTEVELSTNGFLSFDIGSPCNDNYNWDDRLFEDAGNPIPFTDAICEGEDSGWGGNPLIAGWFDDLDARDCGDVYTATAGTAPDRVFVVEYHDVCHNQCEECGPGDGITFEILLFEGSGDVKVQYQDTFFSDGDEMIAAQNAGISATTGIGQDETVGLGYSWRDPLDDGLAVLYTTRAPEPTPTPSPTPAPSAAASPGPDASPSATAAVLGQGQGPAELPGAGGRPDGASRAGAAMTAALLAAMGLGGLWTVLRARPR
jgi:hypothetical protein